MPEPLDAEFQKEPEMTFPKEAPKKAVFLAFKKPETVADDDITFASCRHCRNKTFLIIHDARDNFPILQCAACGAHIGRIGWAEDVQFAEELPKFNECKICGVVLHNSAANTDYCADHTPGGAELNRS